MTDVELLTWLNQTVAGKTVFTALVSMLPVVELRGGIPFGVAGLGLSHWTAFWAAVVGSVLPAPLILVYVRRVLQWMRRRMPRFNRAVDALETRAHLKGQKMQRYNGLGLYLFVAIPLPGTGVWTGSLAAAFLDMPLRRALPSVALGTITAGLLMTGLTAMGVHIFG